MSALRWSAAWLALLAAGACAEVVRPSPVPPRPAPPPGPSTSPSAAPSATAPLPVAPKPLSRAPEGDIGTAHPVLVEAVAQDAGWVVFCQARTDTNQDGKVSVEVAQNGALGGDRLERFFAKGAVAGERIDALLGRDGSGRWLVVSREGTAVLLDSRAGTETDLGALGLDARDDALSFRPHRALAFDPSGTRLVYLRSTGRDARVVVRTLATGAELALDPGGGDIWRIELEPTGRFVIVRAVVDDTNRDKKLTWPAPVRSGAPPCRGPVTTYDAWVGRGDEPVVRLLPLAGGNAETVTGFVTTLGEGWVVREPSGKLSFRQRGKSEELAAEKCGARVVLVDHANEQLLIACTKPKGRPKLELVRRGASLPLDADVAHQSQDQVEGTRERLFALYPGNDTKLLDLVEQKLLPLSAGDVVLASHGATSLVRRKTGLSFHDAARGSETAISGKLAPTLDLIVEPPLVAAAPLVLNLENARVLGAFSGRPLGLAPDGKVLVARGADADGDHLALGPLTWRAPTLTDR